MRNQDIITIATSVFPDSITWDVLEDLTEDQEILSSLLDTLKDYELFSEDQEQELILFCKELIYAEHIHTEYSFLEYVNWTHILYALIKTNEPIFKPELHI